MITWYIPYVCYVYKVMDFVVIVILNCHCFINQQINQNSVYVKAHLLRLPTDEVHGITVEGSISGSVVGASALVPGKLGYALSTNGIIQAVNLGQHGVNNISTDIDRVIHHMKQNKPQFLNSLGPSDAIWRRKTGSTLAKVMARCLTAPSHYLNQCWLIISKV